MSKTIVSRIAKLMRVAYVPRIIEVTGIVCIVAAAFIAFGLAPALVVAGVALVGIGWSSE